MSETTRRSWLRLAVAGGAFWMGSRLSCFGHAKLRAKDKGFIVFMPAQIGEADSPVTAVYYEDWGLHPRVIGPQVIVAVYSDGRIIWSSDHLKGGPPYRTGRLA